MKLNMSFDEYANWRDSFIGVPPQPNRRRYLKRIKSAWTNIYIIKLKVMVENSVRTEIEKYLKENHKLNPRTKFYSDAGGRRWYVNTQEMAVALKIIFGEHIERSERYDGYEDYLEYCDQVQRGDISLQQRSFV